MFKDSRISITEIVRHHFDTFKMKNNKIHSSDKWLFIISPISVSLFILIMFGIVADNSITLFATILSIMIGLFLNILILLISTVNGSGALKSPDKTGRNELYQETFYNLSFTIIISIFALISLLVLRCDFFPIDLKIFRISVNQIVSYIFSSVFYLLFVHLIFILFLIVYNIFKIFQSEIKNS